MARDSVGPFVSPFRPTSVTGYDTVGGPVPAHAVLPIPSPDAMGPDTPPGHRVRELLFPHAELVATPQVARALGVASLRAWTVGELVDTLADWFVTRSGEARGLRDDLAAHSAELQRVSRELRSTREASGRQCSINTPNGGGCMHSSRRRPCGREKKKGTRGNALGSTRAGSGGRAGRVAIASVYAVERIDALTPRRATG